MLEFGSYIQHKRTGSVYVVFGEKKFIVDNELYEAILYVDVDSADFYLRVEGDFESFKKVSKFDWKYSDKLKQPRHIKFKNQGVWCIVDKVL